MLSFRKCNPRDKTTSFLIHNHTWTRQSSRHSLPLSYVRNMPAGKPAFDARIHLLNGEPDEVRPATAHPRDVSETDEAIARRLQKEMDGKDSIRTSIEEQVDAALALTLTEPGSIGNLAEESSKSSGEVLSLQLARQLQQQEQLFDQRSGLSSTEKDDEELARRLMQEEISRGQGQRSRMSEEDEDMALARRIQNLETQGVRGSSGANQSEYEERTLREEDEEIVRRFAHSIQIESDTVPLPLADDSSGGELKTAWRRGGPGAIFGKMKGRNRNKLIPGAIPPPHSSPIMPQQRVSSRPGPLPYSIAISQMPPAPSQQGRGTASRIIASPQSCLPVPVPLREGDGQRAAIPLCCICEQPAPSHLSTLGKKYHKECFLCMGCHERIDASAPFAYINDASGEKHPLHRSCYAELFGIKCVVCRKSIPTGADGKVSYVKHPFFSNSRMCVEHSQRPGRRCSGCHRFEPDGEGFADLNDGNRCVCMSCCRSVIVDSSDAEPLWKKVTYFFEDILGLPLWGDMRDTPVLIVGYDALNDQLQNVGGAHSGSSQIMTRGLCLSEHQSGRRIPLQQMHFDGDSGRFLTDRAEDRGHTYFQVPDPSKSNPNSSVTAILCLSGLPRDLTSSILAHEATHAWFKLHPDFDVRRQIPLRVEEGCCQLVAFLFLQLLEQEDKSTLESTSDDAPTDRMLRQYFKFSIETDESDAYGEGYREAAKVYAAIGIEALMDHVIKYKDFPVI